MYHAEKNTHIEVTKYFELLHPADSAIPGDSGNIFKLILAPPEANLSKEMTGVVGLT